MECPYCKNEMMNGYFHNGNQPIQWMPKGSKPSLFRFSSSENGVELQNSLSFDGYKSEAYYCPGCTITIAKTK